MKTEETLHLVVIDDSSNDAETVSNMLRNAGHAVRAARVEDAEDLRETLAAQSVDMVLSKLDIPFFSALEALAILRDMELDIPLIALENGQNERVIECLKAGARDSVSLMDPARLEHIVMRELGDLRKRRRHRQCERLLHKASERAQALVDTSRDSIAYVHEGMHIYANESYLQMFGYADFGEVEGMPLMNLVSPGDHGKFKEFLRRFSKQHDQSANLEVHALRASDAGEFQITMEFSLTTYEGEDCIQVVIRDQSLSKELEQRLHDLSRQDLLTGLYNRQHFLAQMRQHIGSGTEQGALIYMEPDQFRRVREEVGIAAADLLIADLAGVLRNTMEGTHAILSRFEGYAFTALLVGVTMEEASIMGARLVKAIEDHVAEAGGRTIALTASVGLAAFSDSITDAQEVLVRAEKARRNAVEAGGNRVYVYNPAAEEMADKERAVLWTKRLKLALRDNSFYLVYQPIVSLHGDAYENYEVFLRMVDDGKEVDPMEFIPVAHQTGLMAALDRWVLHNSVRMLVERWRNGKRTNLFVKLSDASIKDPNLLPWLRDLLKASRLDGQCLVVEVSESIAQSNLKSLKPLVDGLRQLRVRTAIDHFGVAQNAVALLRHVQTDFLKLDGSLVSTVARNPQQQNRLRELTAVAKESKSLTVAEFVEDANTLASLWSCGVDYIQGYFLQRPLRELSYDFSGEFS